MSSAILYAAIVAIWACVLIPRWLRRDSSARVSDETVTVTETPEADERLVPEPRRRLREVQAPQTPRVPHVAQVPQVPQVRGGGGEIVRDREHARVLSSRRRLLGLLVLLVVGSAALAVTRMAAWWVLGPPSAMLLGYLALLREASKADAERRELIGARTARVGGAAGADKAAPAVPVARPVRVPDAEIIDISASRGPADGELYDQYADAKLRAVGD
ncbi:MAG TPA: hypothetical protein VHN16_16750 [Streptosporangiaceae bacterium]|nr:hypothetical protein [Streptosporangiaceae bacterium]